MTSDFLDPAWTVVNLSGLGEHGAAGTVRTRSHRCAYERARRAT
jgi:hypothetical protein